MATGEASPSCAGCVLDRLRHYDFTIDNKLFTEPAKEWVSYCVALSVRLRAGANFGHC